MSSYEDPKIRRSEDPRISTTQSGRSNAFVAAQLGQSLDEPGFLDSWASGITAALGFYNGLEPDSPPPDGLTEGPNLVPPGQSCGIPMGPITSDIADRLVALEPYASTEELDRFGPALQGIRDSSSCVDITAMGDDAETVMDNFTEMAKVPVGRELIEAVSEDPEGDRVRLEPQSSGAGPSTISPDGDATRMYDSVDGQCLPISDTPLPGGDAFLRYNPGETRQGGDEPWMTYPPDLVLFHELIHAQHFQDGTSILAKGDACVPPWVEVNGHAYQEENRTTGVGGYGGRFSENTYREERRTIGDDLPNRDFYYSPPSE